MGWIKRAAVNTRAATLGDPDEFLRNVFLGGATTASGQHISTYNADKISTVYAAIRKFTDATASASTHVYRDLPEGREEAVDTRAYQLLCVEPNPEMSAMDLFECVMQQLQLFGNAFVLKERGRTGFVESLWPTDPGRFEVGRVDGVKYYLYTPEHGNQVPLSDREVVHIKSASIKGLLGLSPIQMTKERLGIAKSQEQFQGSYNKNASMPSMSLTTGPKSMNDEAMKRIKKEYKQAHEGTANAGGIIVLEEGMKLEPLVLPMTDQQFIEQTNQSLIDIANIFNLPSFKLNSGVIGKSSITYQTTEAQNLAFWTESLMPWFGRIERSFERDGDIMPAADGDLCLEFDTSNLLRSDHKTRTEITVMKKNAGIITTDEARAEDGLSPLPEGKGSEVSESAPPQKEGDQQGN